MGRYIDADKLKSEFDYEYIDMDKTATFVHYCHILEIINKQPTADVRENEKGEWEEIAESGLSDLRRCSNCGHIEAVGLEIITPKPNYCPFCGADMRPITALSKNAEIDSNLKKR